VPADGAGDLEVLPLQGLEGLTVGRAHVLGAQEPEILGAGEPLVAALLQGPMLGAPDLVDGVVEMFDDAEVVGFTGRLRGSEPALGSPGPLRAGTKKHHRSACSLTTPTQRDRMARSQQAIAVPGLAFAPALRGGGATLPPASAAEPRPGKACKSWDPGRPHYLPSGDSRNKCTLKPTKPALRQPSYPNMSRPGPSCSACLRCMH
jgi:hypothetical protein